MSNTLNEQIEYYLRTANEPRRKDDLRQHLGLPNTEAARAQVQQRLEALAAERKIVLLDSGLVMVP